MSEKFAVYDPEKFKEDLKIYQGSVKKKDFKTANIISNRIMTNAWLSDTQYYGIVGFFLRQLALDAATAANVNNLTAVNSIVSQTNTFTETLFAMVSSNNQKLKELWISFGLALEKSRKEMHPKDEKGVYTTSVEYTSSVVSKILELLFSSKKEITYVSNNFLKGVISEISRVSRTYGIKQTDLYLLSLLYMIERVDDYVGITSVDKDDFQTRMEKEVLPLIDKLEDIYTKKTDEELVNMLMWDLIKKWRLYYVKFLEPRRTPVQNQQPVIEGKIKEELVEELAEGIESEVINK